jgi:RNA polymerase sigma factor (sigma-70 family)
MGERDADYDLLFAQEFRAVMRAVYLIIHDLDRAEDIAQDAFIQLLRHWKKISRYDRPGAWVRRVAIRLAVDAVKRDRIRSSLERGTEPPRDPSPHDIDVLRAVRNLSPMQRAAIVLFYFEDRPIAEITDILGCSDATTRVHLHRARKNLANDLGEGVSEDAS